MADERSKLPTEEEEGDHGKVLAENSSPTGSQAGTGEPSGAKNTDAPAHPPPSAIHSSLDTRKLSVSHSPSTPSPLHTSPIIDSTSSTMPGSSSITSTLGPPAVPLAESSINESTSSSTPSNTSKPDSPLPSQPPHSPHANHPSHVPHPPPHSRRPSSQLQSTRPAPPSPAPSRRASQIYSPSTASGRDRASSTSSAGQASLAQSTSGQVPVSGSSTSGVHRKLSTGSGFTAGRPSAKARPRSSLGTAMYIGGGEHGDALDPAALFTASPPLHNQQGVPISPSAPGTRRITAAGTPGRSDRTTPVSAGSSVPASTSTSTPSDRTPSTNPSVPVEEPSGQVTQPASAQQSSAPSRKSSHPNGLIVRDYGFPPTDDRFHGLGKNDDTANSSTSRLSAYLKSVSSNDRDADATGSGSAAEKRGWSGFSLLGWRGFMGRKSRSSSNTNLDNADGTNRSPDGSPRPEEDEDDANSEPDFNGGHGQAEDDYAFESSSEDDEEPYGLYRAAYAFEAEGEHEISVEEGEVVEVKGRGGGDGWVIAVKLVRSDGPTRPTGEGVGSGGGSIAESPNDHPSAALGGPPIPNSIAGVTGITSRGKDTFMEGLVPESYLEKVEDEEVRIGMIHAGYQYGQRRTVAPDGISEEPEEASDLESGMGR